LRYGDDHKSPDLRGSWQESPLEDPANIPLFDFDTFSDLSERQERDVLGM
jgi:hypothetical protein